LPFFPKRSLSGQLWWQTASGVGATIAVAATVGVSVLVGLGVGVGVLVGAGVGGNGSV